MLSKKKTNKSNKNNYENTCNANMFDSFRDNVFTLINVIQHIESTIILMIFQDCFKKNTKLSSHVAFEM